MATAFIMDFEGATVADYDNVCSEMGVTDTLPDGALFHIAGEHDGHLYIFDVWEDPKVFEEFAATKIGPTSAKYMEGAPTIYSYPVARAEAGPGGAPALFQLVTLPNVDAATFEALDAIICGPSHELPDHCSYHVNGPVRGDWAVFDCWDSEEGYAQFMAQRVAPAAQQTQVAQPQIKVIPAHNVLTQVAAAH